jgi:RNA polymerase sigma-70 factor (ECF subfamily)
LAYRITGEVALSEDIVQESLIHWATLPEHHVQAYLGKMVTNRCLNHLAATRRQREAYKGSWLPEPIISQAYNQVEAEVDISYGLMILLGKLTPAERAVFLLKESFGIEYGELAEALHLTQANCRQLYHRAKDKLSGTKKRFPLNAIHYQQLLNAFTHASQTGNLDNLLALLQEDIILYSDGGGKVPAALHPLAGLTQVSVFLNGLFQKYIPRFNSQFAVVNGGPGLLLLDKTTHKPNSIIAFDLTQAGVDGIYIIRNPDKLLNVPVAWHVS